MTGYFSQAVSDVSSMIIYAVLGIIFYVIAKTEGYKVRRSILLKIVTCIAFTIGFAFFVSAVLRPYEMNHFDWKSFFKYVFVIMPPAIAGVILGHGKQKKENEQLELLQMQRKLKEEADEELDNEIGWQIHTMRRRNGGI